MTHDADESPRAWESVYDAVRPTYEAFVEKLEGLLEDRLGAEGVQYAWIDHWCYSTSAFGELVYRARREGRELEHPSSGAPIATGVMVVTYEPSVFPAVIELVNDEFTVDLDRSVTAEEAAERTERHGPDGGSMDYVYPRYVVSLTEARTSLPEWKAFEGLRTELALMTLLHYAWERADSDRPFYWPSTYPARVRSLLAKTVEALASADATLAEAKRATGELEREHDEAVARGDLEIEADGTSLASYLRASQTVAGLTELALEAGMQPDEEYEPGSAAIEQGLVWLVRRAGMATLAQLDEFLSQSSERAPGLLRDLARVSTERGFQPWGNPESVVIWLLLVLRRADAETIALLDFRDEIEFALNTLIGNAVPEDA